MTAPVFADEFEGDSLDPGRWLATYLPHWTDDPARTRPCYALRDSALHLSIGPDQPEWCPDLDPGVRVSNLQTGHRAGPTGAVEGQHRFRPGLAVRSDLPERRLFLMHYGRLQMRARARLGPGNLAALWLIGFEDRPDDSGEITAMEVFGHEADGAGFHLGCGVKAVTDPRLRDDVRRPFCAADLGGWHDYGFDWRPDGITFTLDGRCVHRTAQAPDYPMQLMLNLYALPGRPCDADAVFAVDHIRVWPAGPTG